jgi:16S rRNA (guanine527-N7)-methyltransferase
VKHPGLEALADEYGLPGGAAERLGVLLARLAEDPHAPTTVRSPAEAIEVHVADSLAGLAFGPLREAGTVADLGAGAGFPGLVLAVAVPAARVALVESVGRKAEWIRDASEAMGLANVEVVTARAEEWRDGRGVCDVVTARALAALPVLAEYAAPLLREGGHLLAWKGERSVSEEADGLAAAHELGLQPLDPIAVKPFPAARHRHLHPFRKVAPTPARFPRRAGMAVKRPLRAG